MRRSERGARIFTLHLAVGCVTLEQVHQDRMTTPPCGVPRARGTNVVPHRLHQLITSGNMQHTAFDVATILDQGCMALLCAEVYIGKGSSENYSRQRAHGDMVMAKTQAKKDPSGEDRTLSYKEYRKALFQLHVELVRLQEWVIQTGSKICRIRRHPAQILARSQPRGTDPPS